MEGVSDGITQVVRTLSELQGDGLSGLDTTIKQLNSTVAEIQEIQAVLERAATMIEAYIVAVLGFPAVMTATTLSKPDHSPERRNEPLPPALPRDLEKHIFQGHATSRKITGYHHRPGGIDNGNFRVPTREPPDNDGVYQGLVEGHTSTGRSVRKAYTTFFPDSWTRKEVRRAVRVAFANRRSVYDIKGNVIPRKWEGTYRGIRIQGYTRPDTDPETATLDDIATAYPLTTPT